MLLLCAGMLVLTAAAAVAACRLQRELDVSAGLVLRAEVRLLELERMRASQREAASAAEAAVEGGTRLVQGVHQGIAAIPFGILEALPPTRPATRVVRLTHDLVAAGVYGAISLANRLAGKALRGAAKK